VKTVILAAVAAASILGQRLDLSSLDRFAAKASETANVELDAEKLGLVSKFLSADSAQDQKTKDLVSNLKGVFVRTFEFEQPGAYALTDLDPIRQQLQAPGWQKIVEVKEKTESAEVYFFSENKQLGGIAVIAAEPKEIAVVNIVGPIDINALGGLSGTLGIPASVLGGKATTRGAESKPEPKPESKKDDD
jgi:hypothetical protein